MKIVLRRVKSSFFSFVPIKLQNYCSSVSMSMGRAYAISRAYNLEIEKYTKAQNLIYIKRNVYVQLSKFDFLFVPSTHNAKSNKSTIKYTNQICDNIKIIKYLHFTHFGFLRKSLPKSQIKCILDLFLSQKYIDCEVCWDIDEKFFEEMKIVLHESFIENNYEHELEAYDVENFRWDDAYRRLCDVRRARERNETRLVQLQRNAPTSNTNSEMHNQHERQNMVTRQTTENVRIGTRAAGNAGEYYALSLFIRNGFISGKAPEGTSTYDLLVMTSDSSSFKPVQVKTITNGQHWLLRSRHEEVIENLIFCFVKFFDISTLPKIYLIPSSVVSNVISKCHEIYVTLPGVHGERNSESILRTLMTDFSTLIVNVDNPEQYLNRNQLAFIQNHSLGWLDEYENNFDIFKTQE